MEMFAMQTPMHHHHAPVQLAHHGYIYQPMTPSTVQGPYVKKSLFGFLFFSLYFCFRSKKKQTQQKSKRVAVFFFVF